MTSKKPEGLLMKIVMFISYYFSKKLTCVPWTQRFEKAHESKYQKNFLNTTPDNYNIINIV